MTIDISLPAGASRPSAFGVAHGPGYFVAELSVPGRTLTTGEAIAVGLSAPQPGWRTTMGTDATARWIAANDAALISPKQRLAGFSLASHGPPSLRRFTVAPYIDPQLAPVDPPQPDALEVERFQQEFDQYVESQSVTGLTLAPSALQAMTPDALLANLASQVAQARTLRWISNDAMTRNVTDKLQAARTAIARSRSGRVWEHPACAAHRSRSSLRQGVHERGGGPGGPERSIRPPSSREALSRMSGGSFSNEFDENTTVLRRVCESLEEGCAPWHRVHSLIETLPDCAYLYRYFISRSVKKFLGSVRGRQAAQ